MKILLVTNMFPSASNPAYGVFVNNIIRGLSKKEDIKILYCIMTFTKKKIMKVLMYLSFYIRQFFLSLIGTYDILYIHFPKRSAYPSVLLGKIRRKKILLNFHGTDIVVSPLGKNLNEMAIHLSDLVIVPSEEFRQRIKEEYNIEDEKIYISGSGGISDNFFTDKEYKEKGLIGYVSSIKREKGWEVLCKAYSIISEPVPDLVFYGSGTEEAELKKYTEANKNISYFGFKKQEELVDVYNSLSLFVFPSERESLGLVGLEAMAGGIPVLGSRIGGIKSYIIDGENGLFFEPNNISDLKEKIEYFYSIPIEKRREMSRKAKETANMYRHTLVIEDLYKKIIWVYGINDEHNMD